MAEAKTTKLKNAPIVEALIDIVLAPQFPADIKKLKDLADQLRSDFPKSEEIRMAQIQLPGAGAPPKVTHLPPMGYKLTSKSGTEVLQLKTSGFTFSQLAPYDSWDHFFGRFTHFWQLYIKATQVTDIARIGVRFINDLKLPLPIKFLKDYLAAPPIIPAGLPPTPMDYIMRFVVPLEDIKGAAIITQALGRGPYQGHLPLILDIDVYVEKQLKVTDKDLWDLLPKMRSYKNDIFYKSITTKTEELYS